MKKGYGHTKFLGVGMSVHKKSWICFNKTFVPNNQVVRHKCKFKNCINPDHLEIGTSEDNANDKHRDGTILLGEKHPNSKITDEIAKQIYESKNSGLTQVKRALKFGVTKNIVSSIDRGRTWKHLTGNLNL